MHNYPVLLAYSLIKFFNSPLLRLYFLRHPRVFVDRQHPHTQGHRSNRLLPHHFRSEVRPDKQNFRPLEPENWTRNPGDQTLDQTALLGAAGSGRKSLQ